VSTPSWRDSARVSRSNCSSFAPRDAHGAHVIRLLTCGAMAAARLVELTRSRRNLGSSGPTREGQWSARTYPLMVLLHTTVIGITLLRGSRRPNAGWLSLLLAVQPIRVWVLLLLGQRWNTRGAVPVTMSIETRGPYRAVRHPNYVVVAIELLALPLAFGLRCLALIATAANAALMWPRILEEERALMLLPGYREHFAGKARFIPRLSTPGL
jgi:methyltransferase